MNEITPADRLVATNILAAALEHEALLRPGVGAHMTASLGCAIEYHIANALAQIRAQRDYMDEHGITYNPPIPGGGGVYGTN